MGSIAWRLLFLEMRLATDRGDNDMRSDLVFPAVKTVRNRYELCLLAAKATRRFHKPSTRIQDTMNDILNKVGAAANTTPSSPTRSFPT